MKRALIIALILFSNAYAQESIPFTDYDKLALGPKILVKPEIIIHNTIVNKTTYFTVNLSNPGTVSFPKINFLANESSVQRATSRVALKKQESKTFNISVRTNKSGVIVTKILFTGYDAQAESKLIILSSIKDDLPIITLESGVVNTLETIRALIEVPANESGELYYGLVNMEGEVMGVASKPVSASEEVSISIKVPKNAVPGKYLFFASMNQKSFSGEIIEITTLISLQLLIIIGLLIVGLGALIQASRLRRKEKEQLLE